MSNAYYEVLRTYWQRPRGSWIEMICAAAAGLFWVACMADPRMLSTGQPTSWALSVMGVMLWSHFREQATSELRQLRPGFMPPHVAVFAGMLALIVLVGPSVSFLRTGTSPLGVMAFSAICMAAVGWWVYRLSVTFFFICFAGWFWMLTETGQQILRPFLQGRKESLAWALLAGGICVIAITIRGLIRLTEEDPLYHRRLNFSGLNLRPRMTGDVNRAWAEVEKQTLFGIARSRAIDAPTGTSLWSRTQRWRMLTRSNMFNILFMIVIMVASMRIGSYGKAPVPVIIMFLLWMPAGMCTNLWLQLWRYLEADSVRPIGRKQLIREVGATIIYDAARGWAWMALVIAADATLLRADPMPLSQVLTLILLSLLLQIPAIGTAVWFMRYRSPMKVMFGTMGLLILPGILLIATAMGDDHGAAFRLPAGLAAIVMAIGGVYIFRDAYRRWLVTELG